MVIKCSYSVWKSDQYRCHLTKANVLYSNTGILASTESAVNDLFTNDKLKYRSIALKFIIVVIKKGFNKIVQITNLEMF